MTWFTNLQLLWKVLGVTLTVCAVTVGVGLVGYRGIQQTTADVNTLGSGLILKVAAAGRMHQSMYEAVADLRGATLASDPADIKDFAEGTRTAMGETDAALAQYQAQPLTTEEKRILDDYKTAHTAWESAAQQTLVALEAPPPPVAVARAKPAAEAAAAPPTQRLVADRRIARPAWPRQALTKRLRPRMKRLLPRMKPLPRPTPRTRSVRVPRPAVAARHPLPLSPLRPRPSNRGR